MLTPLQLMLSTLWEQRRDGVLSHASYKRIGGYTGALPRWCDSVIDQLPAAQRDVAWTLLTPLVRSPDPARQLPATRRQVARTTLLDMASHAPGSGTGDGGAGRTTTGASDRRRRADGDRRRRADEDREPARRTAAAVLALLVAHHIVTTHSGGDGRPDGTTMVELRHDVLAYGWENLVERVERDERFGTWLRRAEERCRRWNEHGERRPGDLLGGSDLAEALEWAARRVLPEDVARYVAAGRRAQQAALRRAWRFNAVLIGFLVLALTATGVAVWQRDEALDNERLALSRQIAAQSTAHLDDNPDLASLLAMCAYQAGRTPEAKAALFAAAAGRLRRRSHPHDDAPNAMAVGRDGRLVATGGSRGYVEFWDLGTGRGAGLVLSDGQSVYTLSFSPDGRYLAVGGESRVVRIVDVAKRKVVRVLRGHRGAVLTVQYGVDGRTLTSAGEDETLRIWDVRDGRPLGTVQGVDAGFARSPDGRTLATHDTDGRIRVRSGNGRVVHVLDGSFDTVLSRLVYAPDGRTLAAQLDNTVVLMDPATGRVRTRLTGHTDLVGVVAFSPDGRTVATGSWDMTVRLWDATSGRALDVLAGPTGEVEDVAFSPDGRTLLSVDDGGALRWWDGTVERRVLGSHPRGV